MDNLHKTLLIIVCLFAIFVAIIFADDAQAGPLINAGAESESAAQSISGSTSVSSQGNAQTIQFNGPDNVHYSGRYTIRDAPAIGAPIVGVTAPCKLGVSGAVSGLGFGVALGTGIEDEECTLRETARLLYSMGQPDAAIRVMCNNPLAAKALGPEACAFKPSQPIATPVAVAAVPGPVAICEMTVIEEPAKVLQSGWVKPKRTIKRKECK